MEMEAQVGFRICRAMVSQGWGGNAPWTPDPALSTGLGPGVPSWMGQLQGLPSAASN